MCPQRNQLSAILFLLCLSSAYEKEIRKEGEREKYNNTWFRFVITIIVFFRFSSLDFQKNYAPEKKNEEGTINMRPCMCGWKKDQRRVFCSVCEVHGTHTEKKKIKKTKKKRTKSNKQSLLIWRKKKGGKKKREREKTVFTWTLLFFLYVLLSIAKSVSRSLMCVCVCVRYPEKREAVKQPFFFSEKENEKKKRRAKSEQKRDEVDSSEQISNSKKNEMSTSCLFIMQEIRKAKPAGRCEKTNEANESTSRHHHLDNFSLRPTV